MQSDARQRTGRCDADQREYRLYTALLFPAAFFVVLLSRVWPATRSPYLVKKEHTPFLSEVIDLCRSAVPWVFMGR